MILNKTTKASDRYRIIAGSMGNYGCAPEHPNHKFEIAFGAYGRSRGYQGSMAVDYFLRDQRANAPQEARHACIAFLRAEGYGAWLDREGIR